jgi:hypothetical protein
MLAAEAWLHFERDGFDAPYAARMVELVRRSCDPLDTVTMLNSLAWAALIYNDPGFALRPAEEAAQRAGDMRLLWYSQVIAHTAALAALALNRPSAARRQLEAATSSMVSCSAGGEEDRAILLAAAAVLAAHDDDTGAQHLLQALPVDDDLRADRGCRWDICEPYLRHVVATASDDPDFASDSLAGYALERLERLPELVAR